jgi:DNA polymerase III epsilon subunit-like protein
MIVIDIETSGNLDMKNGIWQIGALEFENLSNTFLGEARIDDEDDVEEGALKVTGKTEEELRDKNKQSQKELLERFFSWVEKIENKTFVAHNTPFDYGFITLKAKKYGLKIPFGHRTLDLHVLAFLKYYELNNKLPFEEGKSTFNLSKVLEFCGIEDKRIRLKETEVVKEGNPHNGLEDAKLEAECLSRILYGKGLLPEFESFEVPEYLRR